MVVGLPCGAARVGLDDVFLPPIASAQPNKVRRNNGLMKAHKNWMGGRSKEKDAQANQLLPAPDKDSIKHRELE